MRNDLPESPTSVTYSVTSPKGYNALVTIRDEKFSELVVKMEFAEKWFDDKGYKPQVKGFPKKELEYVEGKKCPKCGSGIVKKLKKDGKPYHKCEKGGWDKINNKPTGCDYIDWLEPKPEPKQESKVEEYDFDIPDPVEL